MGEKIEIVDGSADTAAMARISSDVMRWTTKVPETIEHFRALMPTFRNWLALSDGEPVGAATCVEPPDMKESNAAWAEICVLEGSRRRGVGTKLLNHASAHARSLGKSELEVFAFEDDPDALEFAKRRGFGCIMRLRSLRLVLAGREAPPVDPPDGVTIASLADRPDLARDVWEVATEAMPDIPIDSDVPMHPGTFEEFRTLVLAGPRHIPGATFVALHDGRAIGYGKLAWQDRSRGIGSHDMLAVRRAFRDRGVGRALKAAQIAWAIENGLTELRTENEERNTAARAVNAKFPYEPIPDGLLFRGPLAPE